MSVRRPLAAVMTLAFASAFALAAVASPASADVHEIDTEGWAWSDVNDETSSIEDVNSWFPDFLGTGVDTYGWNFDAFDGLPDYSAEFDGTDYGWDSWGTITPPSVVDGAWSVTVGGSTGDVGDGNRLDVEVTLIIEGSFARWDFAFDVVGPDQDDWEFVAWGNLGSDGGSTFIPVGSDHMVSHDGAHGPDPVIGWQLIGDAVFDVTNGHDDPEVVFDPSTADASLVLGLLAYDLCSHSDAVAAMTGYLAQFDSLVGSVLPPLHTSDCVVFDDELSLPAGVAFDLSTGIAAADELSDWWGGDFFEPFHQAGDGWHDERSTIALLVDGPAGLQVEFVRDDVSGESSLRFFGMVSDAAWTSFGTAPIRVAILQYNDIYYPGDWVEEYWTYPIVLEFTVSRVLPATGAADASASALGGLGLLALGAVLALTARRRIRNP